MRRRRRRRRKRGRAGSPHPGRPEAPRVCTRAELIPPQRAPATLLSRCAAAWPRSRLSVAAAGSGGSSLGLGDLAAGLPVALAHGGEAGGGQPGGEADGLGEPDLAQEKTTSVKKRPAGKSAIRKRPAAEVPSESSLTTVPSLPHAWRRRARAIHLRDREASTADLSS
ncbi:unnamed protein product, partial [Prorocentrum cordatum]